MNAKPPLILVAEDDKSVRLVVQQALARQGYAVQSSGTAAGLWKLIESGKGDVLITDVALPDGDALDLLPRIQERRPDLPVIVMSARSTLLTAVKAQQVGVFEYLPKPFELRSLIEVTQRAVETIGTPSRSSTKTASIEEGGPLIGRSRPMQDIFKAMARVVSTDLTVLVTGESGRARNWLRVRCMILEAAALALLSRSILPRYRVTLSKPNYSGGPRMMGLVRQSIIKAGLNRLRAERYFLMRSAICRPRLKQGFCGCCRMVNICPLVRSDRSKQISGSLPQQTRICITSCIKACFVKICFTG
jgi:CheY-like chemotaxis protein